MSKHVMEADAKRRQIKLVLTDTLNPESNRPIKCSAEPRGEYLTSMLFLAWLIGSGCCDEIP